MSNPKCVTHFTGCDCQEAKLAQLTQELEAVKRERDEARSDLGAKNLLWNSLIAERDRLQAQLATAKDALEIAYEKLKTLPWRGGAAGPTWLTIPRQALADIHGEK